MEARCNRSCQHPAGTLLLAATLFGASLPVGAQQALASPEAAAQAVIDALASGNDMALVAVHGADWKRHRRTAGVDNNDRVAFLEARAKSHRILRDGSGPVHLAVGIDDWNLSIPTVARAGAWRFDAPTGANKIRTRRIGRSELAAMQAVLADDDGQKEYATEDRNRDGMHQHAQRLISKPGDDDLGYSFRILKGQGSQARGGAHEYRIKGRMTGGFAQIARPLRYGDAGMRSFVVSDDGRLYEKNLGRRTESIARSMTRFGPDATWTEVKL